MNLIERFMKKIRFTKKAKLYTSVTSMALIIVGIITPFIYFATMPSSEWKNDGTINIWLKDDPMGVFYTQFEELFVEPFNEEIEDTGYEVVMTSVTPENSLGDDIGLKMSAGAEVPNIFYGDPSDTLDLLQYEGDVYVYDMTELIPETISSDVLKVYSEEQGKYITPYAPFSNSSNVLFVDGVLMNEIINEVNSSNVGFTFSADFVEYFDREEFSTENEIIYTSNGDKPVSDLEVTNTNVDTSKLEEINNGSTVIDMKIFESYEGVIVLADLLNQTFNKNKEQIEYMFAFDHHEESAFYLTYNLVGNDYDNWIISEENEANLIESVAAQEAVMKYYDLMKYMNDEDFLWVRENGTTNPTTPFVNHSLLMFDGKNYNAKYIDMPEEGYLQYEEVAYVPAPTKVESESTKEFSYLVTKSLNVIQFSDDGTSGEDIVTAEFIKYVYENINYEMFVQIGYLPPITSNTTMIDFKIYLDQWLIDNEELDGTKEYSVAESLSASLVNLIRTEEEDFDLLYMPITNTYNIYKDSFFTLTQKYIEGEVDDPVQEMINDLNTNGYY